MSKQRDSILDKGFEAIVTGMEMINAVLEAHKDLQGKDEPKCDHPASFEQSLQDNKQQERRTR